MIFQGGGAIGAYAAGVYAVLYHWVKKDIVGDENVFDIVAGASAGAINACIIVSHVIHTKNHDNTIPRWKGSVQKVLDFWHDTSSPPDFTKWKPFFSYDWPFFKNEDDWISVWNTTKTDNKATGEVPRKYYSAKEFLYSSAPNVFSHYTKESDERFYDWSVSGMFLVYWFSTSA